MTYMYRGKWCVHLQCDCIADIFELFMFLYDVLSFAWLTVNII